MTNDREAALKAAIEWLEEFSSAHRLGFDVQLREDLCDLILNREREAKIEALNWILEERWTGEGAIYEGVEAEIARLEKEGKTMTDRFSSREDFQADGDRLRKADKTACICPAICDCQNPEGRGVRLISELCPIHNDRPMVDPDCLATVHKNGVLDL